MADITFNEIALWIKLIDFIILIILSIILSLEYKKSSNKLKLYLVGVFSTQAIGMIITIGNYFFQWIESGPLTRQIVTTLGTYFFAIAGLFMIIFSFNVFFILYNKKTVKKTYLLSYLALSTLLLVISIINTILTLNELVYYLVVGTTFILVVLSYILIIYQTIKTGYQWKQKGEIAGSLMTRFLGLLFGTILLLVGFIIIFIEALVNPVERSIFAVIGWVLHLISMFSFYISFRKGTEN
ncbi:MAG: hypothetical protein GY870_01505 [archaeon]|nr:hypothetical protein [archaeon]